MKTTLRLGAILMALCAMLFCILTLVLVASGEGPRQGPGLAMVLALGCQGVALLLAKKGGFLS